MSIKEQLIEHMKEKGVTQSQVARAINKSPAVVNQYLKDSYAGNVNIVEQDIKKYLEHQQEKQKTAHITVDFVRTATAAKGLEIIKLAHLEGDINVIYGDAGLGKTMIVKEYARQNRNAILIEADPGYTARALLDDLSTVLNVNKRGSIHDMSNACIEALRGSERIIIVDEAELLPYRALEVLRRVHDKSGVGVLLAGMPRLIVNLKGKKGEYAQLYSRVGFALNLGNVLSSEDLQAIAVNNLPEAQSEDIFTELLTASRGNARRMFKLLRGVRRMCEINNMQATREMIKKYSSMLIN